MRHFCFVIFLHVLYMHKQTSLQHHTAWHMKLLLCKVKGKIVMPAGDVPPEKLPPSVNAQTAAPIVYSILATTWDTTNTALLFFVTDWRWWGKLFLINMRSNTCWRSLTPTHATISTLTSSPRHLVQRLANPCISCTIVSCAEGADCTCATQHTREHLGILVWVPQCTHVSISMYSCQRLNVLMWASRCTSVSISVYLYQGCWTREHPPLVMQGPSACRTTQKAKPRDLALWLVHTQITHLHAAIQLHRKSHRGGTCSYIKHRLWILMGRAADVVNATALHFSAACI